MDDMTKNTAKNTILLYMLTFAKLVFPLLTLPYLTRALTPEGYGVVSYVKSCMSYMQIIIDFGFILSGVKDIVNAKQDKEKIGEITGDIIIAKIFLSFVILVATIVLCFSIPILNNYKKYTILYAISIMITAFSTEYLFRGMEKMHIITIIYIAAKGIVTILTFILVKSDADLLLIPIMEIIGNIISVFITWIFIKRLKIPVRFKSIKQAFIRLKTSSIYFFSSFSGTAFTALNTVIIGIVVEDLALIAYWSVAWQLIGAVVALYSPIIDGVYPQMIQKKDLGFIKKMLILFMPIILVGCTFCFICSKWILHIFAGEEYIGATLVFRLLLPVLIFAFPSMLLGWPTLGSIGKMKNVTISTLCGAICQIFGLIFLILIKQFSIYTVAIVRGITEIVITSIRIVFLVKYRKCFNKKEL